MKIVSAAKYTVSELTALFNAGFEGYFVPIDINEAVFSFLCAVSLVDFSRSTVAEVEGVPAGFLLLGGRGWTVRGAAMGIVTEHRNSGIGTTLMQSAVTDCREANYRHFILEVFEENAPAIAVYQKCGFTKKRRLIGYERPANAPLDTADALREIDPYEIAMQVAREADPDLPWMCSPEFYAGFPPDLSRGYALEDKAYAIVMPKTDELARLSAVIVPKQHCGKGWGRRMIEGLAALHPGKAWEIIPVVPEGLAAGFLVKCGFQPAKLNQLEMERTLI
jgi:GNAT superfamily N-acetyltransferase